MHPRSIPKAFIVAPLIAALGLPGCAGPLPSSHPTGIEAPSAAHVLALREGQLSYFKLGRGPAVVVLHGVGGHKGDWLEVARQLAPRHTVYAVDMLGFGASSKDYAEIPIALHVDAVKQLLDREGLARASLIGNSVGGWVAASFAARYPQAVERLVLVDAAGFKAMFDGPPPANLYPENVEDMSRLMRFMRASAAAHTPEYAAAALAALNVRGDRLAARAVFKGLMASPRLEEVGPQINAPTLVVWGADDALFPLPVADHVTGLVPGARKLVIAGAGHFPQLDQAAAFTEAVDAFLRQ